MKNILQKHLLILIIFTLVFTTGCSRENQQNNSSENTTTDHQNVISPELMDEALDQEDEPPNKDNNKEDIELTEINESTCDQLRRIWKQGDFSSRFASRLKEVEACHKKSGFKLNEWNNGYEDEEIVSLRKRCHQIKEWWDAGDFTAKHPEKTEDAEMCEDEYWGSEWYKQVYPIDENYQTPALNLEKASYNPKWLEHSNDWNLYEDGEHNYRISFPRQWFADKIDDKSHIIQKNRIAIYPPLTTHQHIDYHVGKRLTLSYDKRSLEEFMDQYKKLDPPRTHIVSNESFVEHKNARKIRVGNGYSDNNYYLYIPHNNGALIVSYEEGNEYHKSIINILELDPDKFNPPKINKEPQDELAFIKRYYSNIASHNFNEAYKVSKKSVSVETFSSWYKNVTDVRLHSIQRERRSKYLIELTIDEDGVTTGYITLLTLAHDDSGDIHISESIVNKPLCKATYRYHHNDWFPSLESQYYDLGVDNGMGDSAELSDYNYMGTGCLSKDEKKFVFSNIHGLFTYNIDSNHLKKSSYSYITYEFGGTTLTPIDNNTIRITSGSGDGGGGWSKKANYSFKNGTVRVYESCPMSKGIVKCEKVDKLFD